MSTGGRDDIRAEGVIDDQAADPIVAVIPTALIAGGLRGIPHWWRLIDCSFGVLGIMPLWVARLYVKRLEGRKPTTHAEKGR